MFTGLTGMLWYDNGPAPLSDKLKKAADYYKSKYGRAPDLCFVHPDAAPEGTQINGLTLHGCREVSKDNFWLGVENA
jgi:hypothetical protein